MEYSGSLAGGVFFRQIEHGFTKSTLSDDISECPGGPDGSPLLVALLELPCEYHREEGHHILITRLSPSNRELGHPSLGACSAIHLYSTAAAWSRYCHLSELVGSTGQRTMLFIWKQHATMNNAT